MKCPKCGNTEQGVITGFEEPHRFHCWNCHYVCLVRYTKHGYKPIKKKEAQPEEEKAKT